MTGFDIALLILVGLGAITGFARGFVQEVLALAAWFVGLLAIRYLHTDLAEGLAPYVGTPSGAAVLAFALLLLVPYAVVKLVARAMGEASRNSVLGPIDRILGGGFGILKGLIIAVMAFSVMVLAFDTVWGVGGRPDWITQSRSYPFVNAASEELVKMIGERRKEVQEAEAEEREAREKLHRKSK